VSLPQIPTAIAVFIFKQFFDGLPRELEEVARMDGAGYLRIYRRIIMPLARPAVAAVAIFTFVTVVERPAVAAARAEQPRQIMTVPVGLATVQGSFGIRYADTMASAILGAIPLVAVFLLFQRHIVEGIAGTGLKGRPTLTTDFGQPFTDLGDLRRAPCPHVSRSQPPATICGVCTV
jgi:multiple sugar transport system permease protein